MSLANLKVDFSKYSQRRSAQHTLREESILYRRVSRKLRRTFWQIEIDKDSRWISFEHKYKQVELSRSWHVSTFATSMMNRWRLWRSTGCSILRHSARLQATWMSMVLLVRRPRTCPLKGAEYTNYSMFPHSMLLNALKSAFNTGHNSTHSSCWSSKVHGTCKPSCFLINV